MNDAKHKAAELRQLASQGALIHTWDWVGIARLCNSAAGMLTDTDVALSEMAERAGKAEAERDLALLKLETSQVALKGAEERAKMLLDAKNHWAERARTAESRLDCYVDGVRALLTEWDQLDDMEQNRRLLEIHQRADAVVVERSVPKGDRFTGTDCDFYEPGNGNACMNCGTMHGSE